MNKPICKKYGDSRVCYFLVDKAQKRMEEITKGMEYPVSDVERPIKDNG